MRSNIEGKIVVISGASSGLGEATAPLLSTRGAILVLGARRQDRLKAVAGRQVGMPLERPSTASA
jgi:NADP-dependent 3-hydroxy acid dehydrogenase YdfG